MRNIHKTIIITVLVSLISIVIISYVQIKGQESLALNASYLDPIIIDILAFIISLFFIFEGSYRIYEHPDASWKRQFTRSIRIAFGFGILTTHILQFFHKTIPVS